MYYNMGLSHEKLKQYPEAIAAYKKLIAIEPKGLLVHDARKKISELSTTQPANK